MNSNAWGILICLYYNKTVNDKNYTSKKEFKKII